MVAITDMVSLENQGEVAVISIDNPPVNALSYGVRKGIADGIQAAVADASVKAIVLICQGRTFIAGADITEFGKPPQKPEVNVIDALMACTKPLIAAIHGTAFGGGLEVSLISHFRVAVPAAQFGLPEVKLGILPGYGGTQRLPRVVGVEKALEMISLGNPIGAEEALKVGLVDEIIERDLATGALNFANKVIAENRPLRKIDEMNEKIDEAKNKPEIFTNFRKSIAHKTRGFEAPEACVQAIEAAVNKPINEGLQVERELFKKLIRGQQAAAQQYYFFAERQVRKIPDIPKDTPQLDIKKTAVIGAGTMGGGITMNLINVGIPVTLVETKQEFLDRGLGVIKKNYDVTVSKGKLKPQTVDERMAMITGTCSIDDVADADIIIEAVYENMALKKEIFGKLNTICRPDTILASNTSALNINDMAKEVDHPENVIGLHFFSPANVMRLLEIVRGEKTSKTVLATCITLAQTIKKIAVVVGVCPGFAGNRMFGQRGREVQNMLLEGATIAQLDKAIFDFGFPMGPFVLADLIGLDLGWDEKKSKGETIRDRLCEKGRRGLKTGAGYYRYEKGSRMPIPDPEVDQLITDYATEKGYTKRDITNEEILERCLYPVINEGAKILEEGIAVRPSDLDVIWVNGYGWPVYRGGPMFYADSIGLDKILDKMKFYQDKYGDIWQPAPLLEKLAKEGKGFRNL